MNEIQEYVQKIRRISSTPEQAEKVLQKAQNIAEATPVLMKVALQEAYEDLISNPL